MIRPSPFGFLQISKGTTEARSHSNYLADESSHWPTTYQAPDTASTLSSQEDDA